MKIGCTSKLEPGGEDDYQYDSEDEEFLGVVPQEEIIGIDPGNLQTHESKAKPYSLLKPCAHRGSQFVWGNSHLTSEGEFSRGTNYVAFYTKTMFRGRNAICTVPIVIWVCGQVVVSGFS